MIANLSMSIQYAGPRLRADNAVRFTTDGVILLPFDDSGFRFRAEYSVRISATISVYVEEHLPVPDVLAPVTLAKCRVS